MASYSFKNVGVTTEDKKSQLDTLTSSDATTYYSIATPLQLGSDSEGILHMHTAIADQVSDNLRNLILTNWGERVGKYKFGANLRELTTEIVTQENFDAAAMQRIRNATAQWMPYVNLKEYASSIDKTDSTRPTGKIDIMVTYSITGIADNIDRSVQVSLYII